MCSTCSSMINSYSAKLGRHNYSNAVDTINFGSYKPKVFSAGLVNARYSNMTTTEAQSACQAEYDADPVAFFNKYGNSGGDFSACIKKLKAGDTQSSVLTTISNAGNFFNQLSSALHVFVGGQAPPDPLALPGSPGYIPPGGIPPAQPQALGAGAWIAIILSLAVVGTVIVVVAKSVKSGKAKAGTPGQGGTN